MGFNDDLCNACSLYHHREQINQRTRSKAIKRLNKVPSLPLRKRPHWSLTKKAAKEAIFFPSSIEDNALGFHDKFNKVHHSWTLRCFVTHRFETLCPACAIYSSLTRGLAEDRSCLYKLWVQKHSFSVIIWSQWVISSHAQELEGGCPICKRMEIKGAGAWCLKCNLMKLSAALWQTGVCFAYLAIWQILIRPVISDEHGLGNGVS